MAPATVTWNNPAGGNWATPSNWDSGQVPGLGDDVIIPALGGGISISHSTNTADVVHSVTSATNIVLSNGSLTVAGNIQLSAGASFNLQGGTLASATIAAGPLVLTNGGGTLSQVTVSSGVTVDAARQSFGSYATVTGGLTLNGTLDLGSANASTYGQLTFQDSQTLSGNGTVVFGGSNNNALYARGGNIAATLTIGSGITIQGGSGTLGRTVSYSNDSVVNNGTISVGSGQTLTVDGVNWVNSGSITANGATVNLSGSFATADLGTFSATNGTVNLKATLNNTASTLALTPALGNWHLYGGTINGGTISATAGMTLALSNNGGTLAGGVVIAAGATVDGSQQPFGSYATVTGGLTLNGTLDLGSANASTYGQLTFQDSQTLSGNGTVVFGGSNNNALYARGGNIAATLTIGSGITIQGGSGTLGRTVSYSNDSVVNNGTISVGSGQTLTVDGVNWVNSGSITANGATVNLSGSFATTGLGTFSATNGTVNLKATLNNTASTLALTPVLGNWHLYGGTINGGTISATAGMTLALSNNGGTLAGGVVIAAGATVDGSQQPFGSYATVTGGLTLNGTLDLGSANASTYGQLTFQDSQTLSGNGTVVFGGSNNNALYARGGNIAATLTIGSGITIQGGSGTLGRTVSYSTDSVVNNGTISVGSGQTLTVDGVNWVNSGSITANGATVNLSGSFSTADLGTFSATNGTVNLKATLNNAGTTLALTPALGSWHLDGGTINGGTISATSGMTLALSNSGGTLAGGVVIAAGATVDGSEQSFGSYATVTGGLTLNGTLDLGAANASTYGQLTFQDSQTLSGNGTVVFGGSNNNALYARGGNIAATLTIGSGITIQGGSGTLGRTVSYSTDSVVNNGTISVGSGQTLTVDGVNWVNSGSIIANGATVNLSGSFATADLGTFSATNGTVNLKATLNNAGTTLALTPALGNWHLYGGTINGGTISATGGVTLALSNGGGALAGGVVVAAGATVDATQSSGNYATVTGGFTLNGMLNLGAANGSTYGQLTFQDTQTLGGSGTVVFGGSTSNALYVHGSSVAATLTIGNGITIQGGSGTVGRSSSFGNDSVVINGPVHVGNAGTLDISNSFRVDGAAPVTVAGDSSLAIGGNFVGTAQNVGVFQPQGAITLNGSGTASSPQLLEAMSADLGSGPDGFTNNLAYGSLDLANNTYVQLVNQWINSPGSSAEAVYVNSLLVPNGCTLDLHGLHLYAAMSDVKGVVTGGVITNISFQKGDQVQVVVSVGTTDATEAQETEPEFVVVTSSGGFSQQVNVFDTKTFDYTIQQDGETFQVSDWGDGDHTATMTFTSVLPPPQVTLTSPLASDSWQNGIHSISWAVTGDTSGINNFLVSYSLDGGTTYLNDVGTASSTTRSISWTVPSVISPSAALRIRVEARDAGNSMLSQGTSDLLFLRPGLTIIAHGFSWGATDDFSWEGLMRDGIVSAAGGANRVATGDVVVSADETSVPALFYSEDSNIRFSPRSQITAPPQFNGQVVLDVDWRSISNSLTHTATTGQVADALFSYLTAPSTVIAGVSGTTLLDGVVHLIGHSRGGSLVLALARDLGEGKFQVDQLTTLDPHPTFTRDGVDYGYWSSWGDLLEPTSNVVFADNYYETESAIDGEPITGAMNYHLSLAGGYGDNNDILHDDAHQNIHLWYYGTVDTIALGDGTAEIGGDWYDTPNGPPADVGFAWSAIRGDARPSEGLGLLGGGDAARLQISQAGGITTAGLQSSLATTPTLSMQIATDNDLQSVISAVNHLSPAATTTLLILSLGEGLFNDLAIGAPAGLTLLLIGDGSATTITGHSPALGVLSGTVLVAGTTLSTSTDSPTILVAGASLTLRDCNVQSTTDFMDPAISVTSGKLDLGSSNDPGQNTVAATGSGQLISNTTQTPVQSSGNTFTVNGSAIAPSSAVNVLPTYSPSNFTVSWTGQGDAATSGLAGFDVYVSDTGGPNELWLSGTTASSGVYTGQVGHDYSFYTIATDNLGNVQSSPGSAQKTTVVPTITWGSPAAITYGTPLSDAQLDASADAGVPGTFVYSPTVGTVLRAGNSQLLSVTFTPTDNPDNVSATATASIDVARAIPTIVWNNPAAIVYGTPLSGTQLDASASYIVNGTTITVPGSFAYSWPAGTVLQAGNNQSLSVRFTPTDTIDYLTADKTISISVNQAPPTVTVSSPGGVYTGNPYMATASATGVGGTTVAGTFAFTYGGSATAPQNAGDYAVVATFTSTDPNYTNWTDSGSPGPTLVITQAIPTITVWAPGGRYTDNPYTATATATGVGGATVAGTFAFTYNGLATAPSNAGKYAVLAKFTSNDSNYTNGTGSASLAVIQASPTITVSAPGGLYSGNPFMATATATGIGGAAVVGTLAFTYNGATTPPTKVGRYTVAATFTSSDTNYTDGSGTGDLEISPSRPSLTGATHTRLMPTSVTLAAAVTSDGGASLTNRGVLYAPAASNVPLTLGSSGVIEIDDPAGTTGGLSENVSGLAPATTYSFVAFATNSVGTGYTSPSLASTFTTPADRPTVTSPTWTAVDASTATMGGTVVSDGGAAITKRGVLYAPAGNANPTLGGNGVIEVDDPMDATGPFTENVTGLTPHTAYSVVAFASNSVGTSYTSRIIPAPSTGSPFTSSTATTFTAGHRGSFTLTTATGLPTGMKLTEQGKLPRGLTFIDRGNGTAILAGTPARGTSGTYPITIFATTRLWKTSESFTLTVDQAATITSAAATTFVVGQMGSFTVKTSGSPPAGFTPLPTGLPSGVTFTDNGDGTATISGIPDTGTARAAPYIFTIVANNTVSIGGVPTTENAFQTFKLTVDQAPAFTSAPGTTFTVGQTGTFTVITSGGVPVTTFTEKGKLPAGVKFIKHRDGTATLTGKPGRGTSGTYVFIITAASSKVSETTQTFTLTVE